MKRMGNNGIHNALVVTAPPDGMSSSDEFRMHGDGQGIRDRWERQEAAQRRNRQFKIDFAKISFLRVVSKDGVRPAAIGELKHCMTPQMFQEQFDGIEHNADAFDQFRDRLESLVGDKGLDKLEFFMPQGSGACKVVRLDLTSRSMQILPVSVSRLGAGALCLAMLNGEKPKSLPGTKMLL